MAKSPSPTKSALTRARILAAAKALFAEHGYAGASVRDIAAAAAADPSLVIRYFGSKEQLFAAAGTIDLHLPDLDGVPADAIGHTLARHFTTLWSDPRTAPGLRVLLRSAATQPEAKERMRAVFASQVVPAIRAIDPTGASDWKTALVSSQVLGFALTRYVLELPVIASMSEEALQRYLGRLIQAALELDSD
ncbi:TetR family transcriptional regulator [Amorphus coralli]|uniref:TetR/AcrR family transcriptional regulator n=1 Tax=Amorphus coralli TaxID=340680 RepID=UPI00035F2E42|nr:TetR family transcriptional regulator [Amorphus coralli]